VAPFSYSCSTRHALYRGNASDSWGTFHLSTGSILGLQCCSAAWELSLLSKEERNPSHELCCVVDGFLPFSQRRARVSPRSRSRLGISQPGWCHKPCNRAPKFQLHLDAYSTKDSAAWPRRGRFTEEWWGLCSSAEQTLAQSEMPCPLSRFTALPRGEAADPGGCPAAWASEERAHPTARPRKASLSSLHSQTLTRRRAGHQKRSRPGGGSAGPARRWTPGPTCPDRRPAPIRPRLRPRCAPDPRPQSPSRPAPPAPDLAPNPDPTRGRASPARPRSSPEESIGAVVVDLGLGAAAALEQRRSGPRAPGGPALAPPHGARPAQPAWPRAAGRGRGAARRGLGGVGRGLGGVGRGCGALWDT
jgi:hypothetical protein